MESSNIPEGSVFIDATGLVVGRMASVVAKRLLWGEKITVVNAERAILTGRKEMRLRELKTRLEIVGRVNPIYGPKHPRRPDTFVRRVVRGMLPMDRDRGRKAYKALRVFVDKPFDMEGKELNTIIEASLKKQPTPSVTVGDLMKEIGWKG